MTDATGGPTGDAAFDAGMAVRRAVLGDDHVDRATKGATVFTAPFQELATRYAWGGTWARPNLDRRTRSCLTVALLAALRCENELPIHLRGALRNGVTPRELQEVLLQVAVYAGVPAANSAFAIAQRTLAEDGVAEALRPASED
jgi:4-carboxymuconolactone decarboxylase